MLEAKRLAIDTMANNLGDLLKDKKLYIATAESCTGGGVAEAITSVPGASGWFDRAFVTYSNEAKRQMLGVRAMSLKKFGAVSERVVKEMAIAAFKKSNAAFTVAVSGIAGPGGATEDKPVGTVWFAWCVEGQVDTAQMVFPGNRAEVRAGAVAVALQGLITRIKQWLAEIDLEDEPLSVELEEDEHLPTQIELDVGEQENLVS